MSSPQCSCAFHCRICTGLLFYSACCTSYGLAIYTTLFFSTLHNFWCYTFCGIATCTALSTPFFSSFFYHRHSLHLCSFSSHLKYFTPTTFCFLIIFFSIPHYITLLLNTSYLFWGTAIPFSSFSLLLQLLARCPNSLQHLYNFPLLSFNSALNLARVCFSLSKLLMRELYWLWDIMLISQGYRVNGDLT